MEVAERARRWVQRCTGYSPVDIEPFTAAFTHRSAGSRNNERLEFLGDAVLNLIAAQVLFERHTGTDEGSLSRLRARLVSGESLARLAAMHGLGEALELGPGELKSGGFRRASILADAFEAVCAALYLDAGLDRARPLILGLLEPALAELGADADRKDAKTELQEWLQARGLPLPQYEVESVSGELHEQVFQVRCVAEGSTGEGSGSSRRRAEQAAAEQLLAALRAVPRGTARP